MGNWIPDMWQPKIAHFIEVTHPVPTSISEEEEHIRDHHPEINAMSPEDAARMDERHKHRPDHIQRLINIHLNNHHPDGAKAGDHPHTHGEDLDVAIPDDIETIAPTYIEALASRKKKVAHPVVESMEEQILMEITELKDMVSQLLGTGESLSTILRHDRGHDDWHRSMGQEPCTSESDCASKAQVHKGLEHRASAPEPSIHDTFRALQGVEHQYTTMSRQLRAQGLDTEADAHAEHARSARMGLDALRRMIEQQ